MGNDQAARSNAGPWPGFRGGASSSSSDRQQGRDQGPTQPSRKTGKGNNKKTRRPQRQRQRQQPGDDGSTDEDEDSRGGNAFFGSDSDDHMMDNFIRLCIAVVQVMMNTLLSLPHTIRVASCRLVSQH